MSVTQIGPDATCVDSTDTLEEATEKGFLGQVFDENPNEYYTVAGVTGTPQSAKSQQKPPTPIPTAKAEKAEPESHKSRRGE
jgi:hypothetical protein